MKPAALMIVAALLYTGPLAGAQALHDPFYTLGALTATKQVARDIYKELIELNTRVTPRNITDAAPAMAKHSRAAGIPDSDIFVGGPRPERHNVVAGIREKNSAGREPVLLLAHVDFVEALKADWSLKFDPFTFTERHGRRCAKTCTQ